MRVKFEGTCEIPDDVKYLEYYIQDELDKTLKNIECNVKNILINSAHIDEVQPDKHIIEGETCPICGFNGTMKVVGLTDEYAEIYCPQCHNKFKLKIVE